MMTAIWNKIKNEPVMDLTVSLAVLQAIAQGLSVLSVAIVGIGVLLRFFVVPVAKVEDVKKDAFYAGVHSTKAAYGLDKHDSF